MAGKRRDPDPSQAARLRAASRRLTRFEHQLDDARAELQTLVLEAYVSGASVRGIAAHVDLSVGRVHELLTDDDAARGR